MDEKTTTFQWAKYPSPLSALTQDFIIPHERRPDLTKVNHFDHSIPMVDLRETDTCALVQQVSNSCEDFGFFQVINHGIPKELCDAVLDVINAFFHLSHDEKTRFVSNHHMDDGKIFHYYIRDQESGKKIAMWMEALYHTWHPTDTGYTSNLPDVPLKLRQVISEYGKEMWHLMTKLMSLISQGLGLDENRLKRILGENQQYTAQANYYPPTPDSNLTLGLQAHTDFNLLTVILQEQGVGGLQVLKDDTWIDVVPRPGALVINVADQLQVLSNDKYKSPLHRAVKNEDRKRVSYAMFFGPNMESVISPIQDLIDEHHPPLYRSYNFADFMQEYRSQEGKVRMIKDVFRAPPTHSEY